MVMPLHPCMMDNNVRGCGGEFESTEYSSLDLKSADSFTPHENAAMTWSRDPQSRQIASMPVTSATGLQELWGTETTPPLGFRNRSPLPSVTRV